ncbi:MAG: EamA family transporter [Gammaproteobacteria bacterium]
MKIPLRLILILILVMALWASAFVGIRAGLKGYTPGSLALLRYLVASLCMAFLYFKSPSPRLPSLKISEWLLVLFLGITGIGVYNIALNYGEVTVSAGITSFIMSQAPVLSILFAMFFLHERLTKKGWIGVLISVVGVALIFMAEKQGAHVTTGIWYVLLSLFIASYYPILQKPLLHKLSPIVFTTYAIWSGTALMLIDLPQLIKELPHAPSIATFAAVYNGIFPGAIAYALWSYILGRVPAMSASGYLYLMPLFATLLGWLLLGEVPLLLSITGGIVALVGAIFVTKGVRYQQPIPQKPESATNNYSSAN